MKRSIAGCRAAQPEATGGPDRHRHPPAAGTPGTGGGASVAALLFDSSRLSFEDVELISDAGGAGGAGSFGSEPSLGGLAGAKLEGLQDAGQAQLLEDGGQLISGMHRGPWW